MNDEKLAHEYDRYVKLAKFGAEHSSLLLSVMPDDWRHYMQVLTTKSYHLTTCFRSESRTCQHTTALSNSPITLTFQAARE